MKLVHSIRMGAWVLIILNLLMAFGSIWVFLRMAPALDNIIKRNTRTLVSCEMMLANIAQMTGNEAEDNKYITAFVKAFEQAKNNITEEREPLVIERIAKNYSAAFTRDREALKNTVQAIVDLSDINKRAMVVEDVKARKLGSAGAWGVVFMAIAVFIVTMLIMRSMKKNLIHPIEEIYSVIEANLKGESMRRCYGARVSKDVKILYSGLNDVLDNSKSVSVEKFKS